MKPTLEALARQLVQSQHWRWLPGMLDDMGNRVLCVDGDSITTSEMRQYEFAGATGDEHTAGPVSEVMLHCNPDLNDDLTALGLQVLVREAWGDPGIHVEQMSPGKWVVFGSFMRRLAFGDTETEALAQALLAAPTKEDS